MHITTCLSVTCNDNVNLIVGYHIMYGMDIQLASVRFFIFDVPVFEEDNQGKLQIHLG